MDSFRYSSKKMTDVSKWFAAGAEATLELLDQVAEKTWAARIRKALAEFSASANVEPFLECFGGHGSLNDLILSERNGHRVTPMQYVWVNTLLQALLSLSSAAAQAVHARDRFALEGNWFEWHRKIQGWFCGDCDDASLSPVEIESAVAAWSLGDELRPRTPADLKKSVETALKGDTPTIAQRRESLRQNAKIANISLVEPERDKASPRICLKCGSNKMTVFRWVLEDDDSTLTAAENNLARKGARARRPEKP